MSLKNNQKLDSLDKIVDFMSNLLSEITSDLEKSNKGNKAASQRVRTGTVKLEKVAKAYRKESILSEKALQAKSKKSRSKAAPAKAKSNAKPVAKSSGKSSSSSSSSSSNSKGKDSGSNSKSAPSKSKSNSSSNSSSKQPVKTQKSAVKAKAFAVKKPTAKLPKRR